MKIELDKRGSTLKTKCSIRISLLDRNHPKTNLKTIIAILTPISGKPTRKVTQILAYSLLDRNLFSCRIQMALSIRTKDSSKLKRPRAM
ncbi:uncharacterized protein Smp_202650 [Schistosoma mansoni]|uniref:uncharacterized protein n=1 Tax=Schistosoma mansoni TaxID=6183 RepID=UPI00022DC834|nr:uncharacterized protein Smp_202650 [Schistosoma mansoni]|eukprot:XP_018651882.1 uncharacterized protein Smp_202650 [Schistosoma mansoni]